jgi:hypothetical protein
MSKCRKGFTRKKNHNSFDERKFEWEEKIQERALSLANNKWEEEREWGEGVLSFEVVLCERTLKN